MTYLLAYLRFEVLRAVRNRRYMVGTVAVPAVLYLVLGRQAGSRVNTGGIPFATYFAVSMISFAAIGSALSAGGARVAMERASGWTRQIRLTSLTPTEFVAAKVLTAVCISAVASLLVGLVARMSGLVHLGPGTWLQLYLTVWFAVLPFAALGMVLGYALDVDTAQLATGLSLMVLSLIGGLFAPVTSFPWWLQDIAKVMPTYEMASGGRAAVLQTMPHVGDFVGLAAWTLGLSAVFVWLYRKDENSARA